MFIGPTPPSTDGWGIHSQRELTQATASTIGSGTCLAAAADCIATPNERLAADVPWTERRAGKNARRTRKMLRRLMGNLTEGRSNLAQRDRQIGVRWPPRNGLPDSGSAGQNLGEEARQAALGERFDDLADDKQGRPREVLGSSRGGDQVERRPNDPLLGRGGGVDDRRRAVRGQDR